MIATSESQYVVLELGEEKYAMRIYEIYEIIKMQRITEIPNSKSFLEGVINLRGKIVPVISLRKRFGMPEAVSTKRTRIVVVNHAEEIVGIVVDGVSKVTQFTEMQPTPEIASGIDEGYFEGIGHTEDGLVSLLRIDRILYD